jgi:hypothetical protein
MGSYTLIDIISYSILIAAGIGIWRYHKITSDDRPFYFIVWLAFINEILNDIFAHIFGSSVINCNIYVLLEALLFCWLFFKWGVGFKSRTVFIYLQLSIVIFWIWDSLIYNRITDFSSFFRIFSSFILVFLAIDQIIRLIVTERSNLLKNSRFLISVGVVIFFSYRALYEVFYLNKSFSNTFYHRINMIMYGVNFLVNIIFAFAALWVPTRQKFTLPF